MTPRQKGEHLALADIRESVEELRFYRQTLFRETRA
jgi:oligoribonuclease (3'-5' exoribonuclease)